MHTDRPSRNTSNAHSDPGDDHISIPGALEIALLHKEKTGLKERVQQLEGQLTESRCVCLCIIP